MVGKGCTAPHVDLDGENLSFEERSARSQQEKGLDELQLGMMKAQV